MRSDVLLSHSQSSIGLDIIAFNYSSIDLDLVIIVFNYSDLDRVNNWWMNGRSLHNPLFRSSSNFVVSVRNVENLNPIDMYWKSIQYLCPRLRIRHGTYTVMVVSIDLTGRNRALFRDCSRSYCPPLAVIFHIRVKCPIMVNVFSTQRNVQVSWNIHQLQGTCWNVTA